MTSFNTATKYFTKGFTAYNEEITLPDNCLPFTGAKFGLLNLQAIACGPATIEHELVLTIDHSGSMDTSSKIEQAIFTLKKIVDYLEEHPNIKANVTIFKFDDVFSNVLERTNITEDNYKSIQKIIGKIRPNGGTNIGLALEETTKYIHDLKTAYPTHQISHIFLTDGEVTNGENDPNILKQLVDKSVYNYFIGYGSSHDAKLLGILSDFEKGSYHYIDAIEKAGFVFGEILHSITHKLLYNCEIVIEHGVIYNYNTNLYTNRLFIGDIVGESNKVYHLFTDTPSTCYIHLKTVEPLEIHIFQETEHDLNFVNYVFRHRTLTLLGEVKQCQEKYETSPRFGNERGFSYGNISDCKMKMQKLFDEMIKYMEDNNDKQNKFIKMLCDDIHISQKTLGTKYGRMCISSRQTSQGTQRIYTVNTTPLDRRRQDSDSDSDDDCQKASFRPNKQRSCAPSFCERSPGPSSNLAIDTNDYEVSNDCMEDSPYLTQTAKTVMRSISYISSSDSEKSDSEKSDSDEEKEESDDELPELLPINSESESEAEAEADELTISP